MEIKTKVFKRKSKNKNSADKLDHRLGKWVLRIEFFDETAGRKRTVERQYNRRTEAVDNRPKLEAEVRQTHGQIVTGDRMTFASLAALALKDIYRPAVIHHGYKDAGVRSHASVKGYVRNLVEYFGAKRIGEITPGDLRSYKGWRFKHGSRRGKTPQSISHATVNRDLATMRRIMRHAHSQGWVVRDIFAGSGVIRTDREVARTRILTEVEEALLLASCSGKRTVEYSRRLRGMEQKVSAESEVNNPYLRAAILLALDAALRRGEILKLRWQDVRWADGCIVVKGTHTKTEQERIVPLTQRVKAELENLPSFGSADRIFPFSDFKRSWATAKRIAGIDDLRFHDLRRTAITRLNVKGVPMAVAGKIAGHARLETTMKHYIATDLDMIRGVNEVLNASSEIRETSEMVN